jgi:hypothetical protein
MAQIRSRTTAATLLLLLLTVGLYGYSVWKRANGINMVTPMNEQLKDAIANAPAKAKADEAAGPKLAMTQNRIDELRDAVAASAAVGGPTDNGPTTFGGPTGSGPDPRGGGNPGGPNPGGQFNPPGDGGGDNGGPVTPPLSPSGPTEETGSCFGNNGNCGNTDNNGNTGEHNGNTNN